QFFLQFEPKHSPRAWRVETFRIFDHQPFVQTAPRFLKTFLDLGCRMDWQDFSDSELLRKFQIAQQFPSLHKRSLQERTLIQPKQIEGNERDRNVSRRSRE